MSGRARSTTRSTAKDTRRLLDGTEEGLKGSASWFKSPAFLYTFTALASIAISTGGGLLIGNKLYAPAADIVDANTTTTDALYQQQLVTDARIADILADLSNTTATTDALHRQRLVFDASIASILVAMNKTVADVLEQRILVDALTALSTTNETTPVNTTVTTTTIDTTALEARVNSSLSTLFGLVASLDTSVSTLRDTLSTTTPLPLNLTGKDVYFLGDEIVSAGNPLASTWVFGTEAQTSLYRWSGLVCANYACNREVNLAVTQARWPTAAEQLFGRPSGSGVTSAMVTGHPGGGVVFMAFGSQDTIKETEGGMSDVLSSAESSVLFAALPRSKIVNARNAITTGSWVDNVAYNGWGKITTGTVTTGCSMHTTVTGRYIAFSSSAQGSQSATFNVAVTGFETTTYNQMKTVVTVPAPARATFLYVLDTQTPGVSRTINITSTNTAVGKQVAVDWFAGWDDIGVTANGAMVILLSMPRHSSVNSLTGAEYERQVLNTGLKQIALRMRTTYNFPVYYSERASDYSVYTLALPPALAGIPSPTKDSHRSIANALIRFVDNGGNDPTEHVAASV